jgi:hypothetical protein
VKGIIWVYRSGLLTYFKHRITSGAVESIINKIKPSKGRLMASGIWSISSSGYIISILRGTH